MKRALFPSLLLAVSLFITCQETEVKVNGNITGTVKDKQTTVVIEHCAVTINPGNKQTYTSGSGEFKFTDVTMGEYTISFSKAGYNSYSRKITVEADKTVQADALLEPAIAPVVNTVTADNIQFTQATLHGIVAQKGEANLKECGFYYGTTESMDKKYICQGAETEFQATLQDLADGTLYYYQAYSVNSIGEGKGEVKTFETKALIPAQVQTKNATDITTTQATLNGSITSKGNSEITECGFYFGAIENPEQKYEVEYESDNFSITVTDLTDGATYYYCAYAVNAKGEVRGEVISLNAQTALAPTVKTGEATGVELYEVVLNGEIISDGGASVTECGFYFGNSVNPTQKYPVINVENGLMSRAMTELSEGTTYYYLAYAINAKGESRGDEKSFTTVPITVPEVTTHEVTNVTETTAKVAGRLNSTGRSSKLTVGFVYDTADGAELGKCLGFTADTASVTTTAFEKTLSGLTKGTTYYVRAYATNEKGTVYGDAVEFTTVGPTLPKVETSSISNVTTTTARFNGKIVSIGERVTGIEDYGYVWSTESGPTLETGEKVSNGPRTSTTSYYYDVTGLKDGTTYFVRAYATNEKGTAYGNEIKFITIGITIPDLEMTDVDNINTTSAMFHGKIKSYGNASRVLEWGFVWSTSPEPTIETGVVLKSTSKNSWDNYNETASGLTDGTRYYVRAYATNEKGTGYSSDYEFTTIRITIPELEVTDVDNINTTSAMFHGKIKSYGNASRVLEWGFVWSTSPEPTIETGVVLKSTSKNSWDNYNETASGLTDGTRYYVRAYATNEKGTGYSSDYEFTTLAITVPTVQITDINNIGTLSASFHGRMISFGRSKRIKDYGFVWDTIPNPTLETGKHLDITKNGSTSNDWEWSFNNDVTGLTDGTLYYVRAYATNEKGTGYSEDMEFETKTIVLPTVSITNILDIGTRTATFYGRMISFGLSKRIKDYGFVWDTIPSPTLEKGKHIDFTSNGFTSNDWEWSFNNDISGLTDGTKYYVRAYATNEKGAGYATEDYEFTTVLIVIPTVTTNSSVFDITTTSAIIYGKVESLGNADKVIDWGFVLSTSPNPTIENNDKKFSGNGPRTSSFSFNTDGTDNMKLSPNTKYYYRAYAINEKGIGYGEVYSFITNEK